VREFFIDEIVRCIDCRVRELNLARPLVAGLPVWTGSNV